MSTLEWFFLGVLVSVTLGVISYLIGRVKDTKTDQEIDETKKEVKETQKEVKETQKEVKETKKEVKETKKESD